jgi:hypothetical protein
MRNENNNARMLREARLAYERYVALRLQVRSGKASVAQVARALAQSDALSEALLKRINYSTL